MSTIAGIVAGVLLLVISVAMGGGYKIFLDLQSLMIVGGGTLAATFISFPFAQVFKFFALVIQLLTEGPSSELEKTISRLVALAYKAEKESIFSLEKEAKTETNRYIRLGLQMLVRDVAASRMARRFVAESEGVRNRHKEGIQMFSFMGKIAPSFGLVGTLIGLINMLRGIGAQVSPDTLGPAMAVALITTLYGAILAFLLFMPAAEKLKAYSENELATVNMVRDATMMIKDGDSSREVEDMLNAYLPVKRRRSFVNQILKRGN